MYRYPSKINSFAFAPFAKFFAVLISFMLLIVFYISHSMHYDFGSALDFILKLILSAWSVVVALSMITVIIKRGDAYGALFIAIFAPIGALFTLVALAIAPLIVVSSVIAIVINYLTRSLAGDNRLRNILVWWGVIFFIVGNLLQFISTF